VYLWLRCKGLSTVELMVMRLVAKESIQIENSMQNTREVYFWMFSKT
jgi:hypothetical protein